MRGGDERSGSLFSYVRNGQNSEAANASAGPSLSRPPLTIWRARRSSWRPQHEGPTDCRLIGRWRIVEADLWDRDYLDLCGPATLTITAQGDEAVLMAKQDPSSTAC